MSKIFCALILLLFYCDLQAQEEHSIAREWNELVLEAIRNDFARPTVHARNLWHTSIAMYDIWSVVTQSGVPFLLGNSIGDFESTFEGLTLDLDEEQERAYIDQAISYAVANLIMRRFQFSPDYQSTADALFTLLDQRGYDFDLRREGYPEDVSAAAFGYYVAQEILAFGSEDNSNEDFDYTNFYYRPSNEPILVTDVGDVNLNNPNRWQPLAFEKFVDQSGNEFLGNIPAFLGAEWGRVTPFALQREDLNIYTDASDNEYYVYHDPGAPPMLSEEADDPSSEDYKWGFAMVSVWSSMLDKDDGVMWDISPGTIGNGVDLPITFDGYSSYYKLFDGGAGSQGRSINPVTGVPYEVQMVPRADYARVLAEFWADGPDSETPPGHWFSILHQVMDHPSFERKWEGTFDMGLLEYDVKAFFALGGTMHDAAVTAWGIKGWYDYVRPVSVIRYMATKGQSSDSNLESYDPHGLPLIPDYIEVITEGDPLAIEDEGLIGEIKVRAWKGPDYIEDPSLDEAGVDWIRAKAWWPYQRPTFVSPPFAGYVSGHSCYSRAAADILTMITGDEYFPGGMGVFPIEKDNFLVFEKGPSVDMELQWATYRDASDQTSLSRIWGGIHPPQDDIPGRLIGVEIAIDAYNKAISYFDNLSTSTYEDYLVEDNYKVYPNPIHSDDRLHIERVSTTSESKVKVELYDMLSRKVRSEVIRPSVTTLDISGLQQGHYFLHIKESGRRQVSEIVIIN